jgi:ketosteroid isomerase-like protein
VSQENIDLVRGLYAELASESSIQEFELRLTDDALGRFLDPEIEWVPVSHSLLAVDSYRGFDGVRRFWREFLSTWETYRVELLRLFDADDRVAVVVRIVGRTHELEVEETRSSLLTIRDGRVVHVQSFADPEGAAEAAAPPVSDKPVRGFAAAINRYDLEAALDVCHPEIEFRSVLGVDGRAYVGHDGIRRYFEDISSAWEEWRVDGHGTAAAPGERVIIEMTMHARGKGSGAPLAAFAAHIWTLRDGKLRRNELFRDRQEAERAAGMH